VRPLYNPDKHGSQDQYRATFAHMPSPYDAPAQEPPAVGLDRSSAQSSGSFASAQDEQKARDAAERKRRGW
jgi:hypothetical protein